MSLAIHLEIGHDASLRTKTTPEGFTHDWEVFVRGCNGAEIHHYIEKVVFHLHETFPKPRRVVKEPPFSLRTSGYAGFTLPIEIYLRNNQEPKKILFNYELVLQPSGPPIHNVQKEKHVFINPSEDFRIRLLKGGAIATGSSQENSTSNNKLDERNQMTSKPRLSGTEVVKKHKMKLDEPKNSDFLNLFGTPITKTSKSVEPIKPKEPPKPIPKPEVKSDKDKEKSDKSKSSKSSHKDREKDKERSKDRSSESSDKKNKDEKKKSKDEKSKERERSKEKSSKKERDKERDRSPRPPSHSPSPKRSPKRPSSPPPAPPKPVSSKDKDYYKDEKKDKEKDEKRDKKEDKKPKKDKKDHKDKEKTKERDKEKEHKEHRSKESKSSKDLSNYKNKDTSPNVISSAGPQIPKIDKKEKVREKESPKESPKEEERVEKGRSEKVEDKSQKHKHKKKDKKEKREERHMKSEKKSEKQLNSLNKFKELLKEPPAPPPVSNRDTDKSNLFGSPKSEAPSTPEKETTKTSNNVPFKDDESSIESVRGSSQEPSPLPKPLSRSPSPMEVEPVKKVEPEKVKVKEESPKKKEKKEKKKDKKSDKDHEKKRKRKNENSTQEVEAPPGKIVKEEENNNSDDESKVSSTEDIHPIPKSECDMEMLRELQHKIMSLKDNADLQKVVQLIAETGQYEVSANTFDFDLCLLDKSTVKQLQDFFSTVS